MLSITWGCTQSMASASLAVLHFHHLTYRNRLQPLADAVPDASQPGISIQPHVLQWFVRDSACVHKQFQTYRFWLGWFKTYSVYTCTRVRVEGGQHFRKPMSSLCHRTSHPTFIDTGWFQSAGYSGINSLQRATKGTRWNLKKTDGKIWNQNHERGFRTRPGVSDYHP